MEYFHNLFSLFLWFVLAHTNKYYLKWQSSLNSKTKQKLIFLSEWIKEIIILKVWVILNVTDGDFKTQRNISKK